MRPSLLAVIAALLVAGGCGGSSFEERPYDRAEWVAAEGDISSDNQRGRMYGDLRNRFLRVGMERRAVERLLGTPDMTMTPLEPRTVGYWMGRYHGCVHQALFVHYDEQRQVERVSLYIPAKFCH